MKNEDYAIRKIRSGIVIDHIQQGKALLIARLLGLEELAEEHRVRISIGLNCDSPTLGKKDIIKVEDWGLTERQLNYVALISPYATINTIKDFKVIEKRSVTLPKMVEDVVICPDRFCITNHEDVVPKFYVVKTEPVTLKCHYCEIEFHGKLIKFK